MTVSIRPCNSCGANRLCRKYGRGDAALWLCVDGPSKCYKHRRAAKAVKVRAA